MRKILHNQRGESIVEILVSFLMLMLLISAFVTAIRGANRMMTQANTLRRDAARLTERLYTHGGSGEIGEGITPSGTETGSFEFYLSDGSGPERKAFGVAYQAVDLQLTLEDGATHTFRKFIPPTTP